MKPSISVVLPTKEERAAFETISNLRKLLPVGLEIIVVDKSDNEFFLKIKKTGVRAFKQHSKGVENAMIEGLRKATGEVIVSLDADGTHGLEGIKRGMAMINRGEADLVLGNRMDGLDPGSMGGYLKFGNTALSFIYNIIYGQHVHDLLTGMLIMDREALDAVKNVQPGGNPIAFFQVQIAKRGFKVEEVPIKYHKRRYGNSRLTKSKFMYGLSTAIYMLKNRF